MVNKNYKRMKVILSVLFLSVSYLTFAQKGFEKEIKQFYEYLNSGDSAKVKSYFLPSANIVHLDSDTVLIVSVSEFLTVCPQFKSKQYKEEVVSIELIQWTERTLRYRVEFIFFENNEPIQCGVDEFTMLCYNNSDYFIDKIYSEVKDCAGISLKEETKQEVTIKIDNLMNQWHVDAADAELDSYFRLMHPEFIFLGTDPSERWTKNDFYSFCQPYFIKGSTWIFKTNWRNIYFSEDGKTAWFEESIDTWMNESRGSGVLILVDNEWKLIHYNLTVLIENEKMKKFLKLRAN